jgi:riboflavin transporter FmnP
MNSNKINTKKMTVMAIVCAFAFICVLLFRFEVGGFLTFDIKDAVLAVASLIYGPISGLVCSFVVTFLEFILISDTGVYGFIMNFLSSVTFSVVCGLIYKYRRSMSGAVVGVVFAALSTTAVMLLSNLFITPLFLGIDRGEVIKMLSGLLLPFNVVKSVFNGSLVLIIYKPFTQTLKKAKLLINDSNSKYRFGFKSVLLLVIAAMVLVAAVLFLVLKMGGTIDLF